MDNTIIIINKKKKRHPSVIPSLISAKTFPCSVTSLGRFILHYHPRPSKFLSKANGDHKRDVDRQMSIRSIADLTHLFGPPDATHFSCGIIKLVFYLYFFAKSSP